MAGARFITFEGLDGAGKTTHIQSTAEWFRKRGIAVLETREPGGTPVGEKVREILLHDAMDLETEALLMFAARCEHLKTVILPALANGSAVVCDRFTDASFAYQGGGRGLPEARLEVLEQWVHQELQPDLTILFDLPYEVAIKRRIAQRAPDRFEREAAAFHERVRAAYLRRAGRFPERFAVIDATMAPGEIAKLVEETLVLHC